MERTEKQLLNNALDALHRLYDRQSSVVEIWALFFATSEALQGTSHHTAFETVVPALLGVVRAKAPADEKRDRALTLTADLWTYLAEILPMP